MFDIEDIKISKCMESECLYCKRTKVKTVNEYNEVYYIDAWYCKLDVNERYYDCPIFRADVDRITDIIRFEVKQVYHNNNNRIKRIGWHIFDNDVGHLVDCLDTFDYEDKDKADKLCKWLNKVDGSKIHPKENSINE